MYIFVYHNEFKSVGNIKALLTIYPNLYILLNYYNIATIIPTKIVLL